jgi:hypothetical protein
VPRLAAKSPKLREGGGLLQKPPGRADFNFADMSELIGSGGL